MKVNKKDIKKWVKALRSGKYQQTTDLLNDSSGFCCLGVACDIFIPKAKQDRYFDIGYLKGERPDDQKYAPKWLKDIDDDFEFRTGLYLTELNDGDSSVFNYKSLSFDEIADLLEAVYIYKVLD